MMVRNRKVESQQPLGILKYLMLNQIADDRPISSIERMAYPLQNVRKYLSQRQEGASVSGYMEYAAVYVRR